jgi:hypothetical protein
VLTFLETGVINAAIEGTNRLIKQVKRQSCGFRNRTNYRTVSLRLHPMTGASENRPPARLTSKSPFCAVTFASERSTGGTSFRMSAAQAGSRQPASATRPDVVGNRR